MDATDLARKLISELGKEIAVAAPSPKRLWVRLPAERLVETVAWLRDQVPGVRLSTSTGIDLREGVGVFHHFAVNGEPLVITLKVLARRPEPALPSLAASIPAALWIEREIAEFLGVQFCGHPDPRRFLKAKSVDDEVRPLRRDFDARRFRNEDTNGGGPCGR